MLPYLTSFTNNNGVIFPDTESVNASGAGATDGTEFVKIMVDESWGIRQFFLNYAGLTPNSLQESVANGSQFFDSIQKSFGVGPGICVQWLKNQDPSITGDRVLLLSGQGILRANFVELDAATYVGDPSNATADYFYRADDAAGTVRNTIGAYLILPLNNPTYRKQYSESNGDFTVTGTSWTTLSAVAVPYQTADGAWRLSFNFSGSTASGSRTNFPVTLSGVTFKSGAPQSVAAWPTTGTTPVHLGQIVGGGAVINCFHASDTTTQYIYSGDVELDSKPTWAENFSFPWGITY